LAISSALFTGASAAQTIAPSFTVLVFSKTTGIRHDSIPDGIAAIRTRGAENHFAVNATEDAAEFTDATLSRYKAVVFLCHSASDTA